MASWISIKMSLSLYNVQFVRVLFNGRFEISSGEGFLGNCAVPPNLCNQADAQNTQGSFKFVDYLASRFGQHCMRNRGIDGVDKLSRTALKYTRAEFFHSCM